MSINIFDLTEAARFLKMTPQGLRRKVANGKIPGAKPGKRWCFREDDLAEYLRSLYSGEAKASWGVHQSRRTQEPWHSTNEATFGGAALATLEDEYNKAVGLPTK